MISQEKSTNEEDEEDILGLLYNERKEEDSEDVWI